MRERVHVNMHVLSAVYFRDRGPCEVRKIAEGAADLYKDADHKEKIPRYQPPCCLQKVFFDPACIVLEDC